jgi:UDP-arabinose 4-epimerase
MCNVLVTGGAGYIGSHVCKALADAGYFPISYDTLECGHEWAVRWGPLEIGDVCDRQRLDDVFEKYDPLAVLHFAAYAYVGESVENPGKYYRNNVSGSLTLLEAMRDRGVRNFIFSSSCATYGIPRQVPISETHSQNPVNPYGSSKWMIECMLKDFSAAHGLQYVNLRYFNAAGADPDGEIGEAHEPETHLVPLVLEAVAGKSNHVTIFGSDYDTPDGTCIRDYIHVSDLADAHVLALQYLENEGESDSFNLGNGKGFSVREVIQTVEKVTGRKINTVEGQRRPGDPPILIGSALKAIEILKWKPKYPDLEKIVADAWAWERKAAF